MPDRVPVPFLQHLLLQPGLVLVDLLPHVVAEGRLATGGVVIGRDVVLAKIPPEELGPVLADGVSCKVTLC